MPLYYNISGAPAVLDWDDPAILPGEAVEVTDAQAAGLSPSVWSATPPAEKVALAVESPRKNASNQSGGSWTKREPAPESTPVEVPDASDAPVAQEAK